MAADSEQMKTVAWIWVAIILIAGMMIWGTGKKSQANPAEKPGTLITQSDKSGQ